MKEYLKPELEIEDIEIENIMQNSLTPNEPIGGVDDDNDSEGEDW